MVCQHVGRFGMVVALFGAVACGGDSSDAGARESDSGSQTDAGGGGRQRDAGGHDDGGADRDTGTKADSDAGHDAAVDMHEDAATDAGSSEPDAQAADAAIDSGSSEPDAQAPDAGSDASVEVPALAAHYAFNENTGTTSADVTGRFDKAVLVQGASWTTGAGQDSAVDLAGGNSPNYVSLPANLLKGCNDVTIALWMKLGSVTNWSRLLDLDGTVDGFLYFTPAQDVSGAPHLYFDIYYPNTGGDTGVSAAYPANTVLVDKWHHVAFTLSGGTGKLYFDGAEIGSGAMKAKPSDLTLGPDAHAWIGRSTFPDPYLDAAIDDLRVSCTAYTAEQIASLAK